MVKNLGKKRIETIKNPYLCPILLNLAKGPSTCSNLAKDIGKPASTIFVQLKDLVHEDENYVIKINNNYELNYSKLIKDFVSYYNNSLTLENFEELNLKGYWLNLDSNKYLIGIFKELFKLKSNSNKTISLLLKELFEILKHFEFGMKFDEFINIETIWQIYRIQDQDLGQFISLVEYTKTLISELEDKKKIEEYVSEMIKIRNPYTLSEITEKNGGKMESIKIKDSGEIWNK
jgi:hypothetical protein